MVKLECHKVTDLVVMIEPYRLIFLLSALVPYSECDRLCMSGMIECEFTPVPYITAPTLIYILFLAPRHAPLKSQSPHPL